MSNLRRDLRNGGGREGKGGKGVGELCAWQAKYVCARVQGAWNKMGTSRKVRWIYEWTADVFEYDGVNKQW